MGKKARKRADLKAAESYRRQLQLRHSDRAESMTDFFAASPRKLINHLSSFIDKDAVERLHTEIANRASDSDEIEPLSHELVEKLATRVEAATMKLGLPLRSGISASSILGDGLGAMQQRVMLTDASVVMVTLNMLLLCNRVGKLIARSMPISRTPETVGLGFDGTQIIERISSDPTLREDWMRMFFDLAEDPLNPSPGRVYGVSGDAMFVWCQIRDAMELFAVAHEFGHHIANHSIGGEVSADGVDAELSQSMEMEADFIGAVLTAQVAQDETSMNVFALSGLGGVILLSVLDFGRVAHEVLKYGKERDSVSGSHPQLALRVAMIKYTLAQYSDEETRDFIEMVHEQFRQVMEFVWSEGRLAVSKMHEQGVRPREKEGGWLPV